MSTPPPADAPDLTPFVELALACVRREYPNRIAHRLESDEDVRPSRELTPVFFGCFDWHSAVHSHWLLARAARRCADAPWAGEARRRLAESLTPAGIAGEARYLGSRPAFERPYGQAWLLALDAEVSTWDDAEARGWATALSPLTALAAGHLRAWLPKLSRPVRSGVHSQTAFALALVLDWARATGDSATAALVQERANAFFADDRDYPLHLEPSGEDFLSPSLGAADLMRRVTSAERFARWLGRVLPGIPHDGRGDWLEPLRPADPSDGRLAHLDGLSLSRAWMLEGIAGALPAGDPRVASLRAAARTHRDIGLSAVSGTHYAGAHWLGTFAVYLSTGPGPAALT